MGSTVQKLSLTSTEPPQVLKAAAQTSYYVDASACQIISTGENIEFNRTPRIRHLGKGTEGSIGSQT
jgi:hypothetical protein